MEAMQYELARNMTLLFFFERLLDKGEPRTLHDLSCQFGSKGFTKEMRQIAGGSQSGLKKFLTQYPSLFSLEGDYVTINTFQSSACKNSTENHQFMGSACLLYGLGVRFSRKLSIYDECKLFQGGKDYNTQAVEYFSEKLSQYGEGTEVPIRSLLGHRSQASPEVRHVSGQHFHEFREFLIKHTEAFLVDDEKETVMLTNYTEVRSQCPPELHFQPDVKIDPQETQTLLDFLAQCIEVKGPILVEQLFQIVSCNLPESMWSNLFNTPTHLTSFLRLFSDSFHIQSNLVTLLQTPKINQKHISLQMSMLKENAMKDRPNDLEVKNAKNLENNNVIEKPPDEKIQVVQKDKEKSEKPAVVEKVVPQLSPRSISDRLKQPKLQQKLSEAQAKSLSPEPPVSPVQNQSSSNVPPSEDKNRGVSFKLGKYSKPNVNIENSEEIIPQTNTEQKPSSKPLPNYNQSLKQRINNLVLKTLQENTGRERQSLLNHQAHSDTWKVKLFQNTRVICSQRECQMVMDDIINSSQKNNIRRLNDDSWPFSEDKLVIGFDCEGINLGVKGQLTLIQLATMTGFSYVFDLISCPQMIDYGLKRLLESPDIVKIMHDCRNDSVNLFRQFNITVRSVFDTQAAHAVLTFQESGKPVYKAKSVALNALCEHYGAPTNPMKDMLKNIYRRDQKYWSRRPLTREMILYASADVLSLVNEKIYYPMCRGIKFENRGLMLELCEEQIYMHINPETVKLKKRQRKTETEVSELRVKLANATKSVVLSNREVRLLRYIELTEEEKEKLKSSAKVAKKLEKLESLGQERDGDSSDDDADNDADYPSLESDVTSPRNSEPTSLTESMQLVDSILNDNKIDRLDKIDKLESILTAASLLPTENDVNKCSCNCHGTKLNNGYKMERVISPTNSFVGEKDENRVTPVKENHANVETQTLSTGDIVVTKIFFSEPTE